MVELMAVTRFVDRPRQDRSITYAARYVAGESLDDLRDVACRHSDDTALAEVPELGVLVVRYLNTPDDHPSYTDYKVVPDGHYLAWSESYYLLYVSSAETFAREHLEVET